ncbi:ABC transporter substrate-binding protein [Parasedimentitalea psychrophila]|uniref:Sugar ABC transporter substrate-binding protein n=1 Tax=Parasedimentitalea psychrophila TaxID=2997337 RepID=A0A9Y2L0M4_9RHOB|nr:sugar ABC transporter substrate-binding protein [Parasedimentitalea psychrophila]WIY25795.1 sugar ABC transporter substrate-binding protein [Parasedimentitalea psychrophila]
MNKLKYGSTALCTLALSFALTGQAMSAETVRVRFAEYSSNTEAHFQEVAAKFNASQSDIVVEIETLPWPEMQQQLITDISAGTAPDISHMATRWMAGFAVDGVLAPIEGLMSDDFADSFVPTYLDLQKQEGHTWGLPIAASARGLFVNNELLAKAGIDAAPSTWDEAYDAAIKIAALDDAIYGIGIQGNDLDVEGYWFYSLWTHGGEVITADGKSGLASEAAIAATNNYVRFIEGGATQPGVAGSSREDLQNLFAAGKLGMVLSGPWLNKQLADEAPDVSYGISAVPTATEAATYGVTDTISVLESSEVKEEAVAFLEYMFNDENRLEFGKIEGFVPVLKSMAAEPFFTEDPNMAVFLEMGPVAKFAPLVPNWEEMAESLASALSVAYSGDTPASESLKAAAAKMDELLAE